MDIAYALWLYAQRFHYFVRQFPKGPFGGWSIPLVGAAERRIPY